MQLSMQVEQQKKIINALSRKLMEFDARQKRLEDKMDKVINQTNNDELKEKNTQQTQGLVT